MGPLNGYVRLHRKLLRNPIWTQLSPAVLKVAVHFLLRANYKAGEWYDGTQPVTIPAGSFVTSYGTMVAECHLSQQQIRDAFAHLKRTHFATYRRTPRWTLVTVVNWATYQASTDEENTVGNTDRNRQRTPDKEKKKKTTKTSASPVGNAPGGNSSPDCPHEASGGGAPFPAGGPKSRGASQGLTSQQDVWFSEWWAAYWRRVARKDAREAFAKHVKTEDRFQQVMAATRAQSPGMLAKEERFRPLGASWLNGERWQDEITEQQQQPKNDDYPEFDL
jgi:hypothetical protein